MQDYLDLCIMLVHLENYTAWKNDLHILLVGEGPNKLNQAAHTLTTYYYDNYNV